MLENFFRGSFFEVNLLPRVAVAARKLVRARARLVGFDRLRQQAVTRADVRRSSAFRVAAACRRLPSRSTAATRNERRSGSSCGNSGSVPRSPLIARIARAIRVNISVTSSVRFRRSGASPSSSSKNSTRATRYGSPARRNRRCGNGRSRWSGCSSDRRGAPAPR